MTLCANLKLGPSLHEKAKHLLVNRLITVAVVVVGVVVVAAAAVVTIMQ
jgi:hypothetical protein